MDRLVSQLDPIHHQGLRIALGAFRTSPAQSLYLEAHEPSLALADPPGTRRPWHSPSLALAVVAPGTRRLKLALNYVLNIYLKIQLTAAFFETKNVKLFEDSTFFFKSPLGIRILPHPEK